MDDLDQECIICTLNLNVASAPASNDLAAGGKKVASTQLPSISEQCNSNQLKLVAVIKPCNHFLHNHCLREWSQIANTCPFCRQAFNLVEVLDAVGGNLISSYTVQDKKQVATLDPSYWLNEDHDEEEIDPCPICNQSDNPEVLLLCDSCDANYHTYCVGLDDVPQGDWFCMECADTNLYCYSEDTTASTRSEITRRRRAPRTQASMRRSRQRLRNDNWLGPWSQIGHRIHGATGLDIDFSEDEDVTFWRSSNRHSDLRETQHNMWRIRLNIARRQGANWVMRSAPPAILPRAQTPVESIEESMAWGDFEKAKEIGTSSPTTTKRKLRSPMDSPAGSSLTDYSEPRPERKLKRPRTRRVLDRLGSSSVLTGAAPPTRESLPSCSPPDPLSPESNDEPSFLSSLLREVDMASRPDDPRQTLNTTTALSPPTRILSPSEQFSSPILSPASSSYPYPCLVSRTTPRSKCRSISPLPLTSRIEPNFSSADYFPNQLKTTAIPEICENPGEFDSHTSRPGRNSTTHPPSGIIDSLLTHDTSPPLISQVRATMSCETKRDISKIVKAALEPHWKSAEITKEQYGCINRDVSRKLYEILADHHLDEMEKCRCKNIATAEVAIAVRSLTTMV